MVKMTGRATRGHIANISGDEWRQSLRWNWTPEKTRRWLYLLMNPYGILVRMIDSMWTGRGFVRGRGGQ